MLFARPCPSSSRIDDGFDEHAHAPLEEIETLDTELGLALEMAFLVIEVGRGDELLAAELRAYFLSLPAQHAAQLTLAAPPPLAVGRDPPTLIFLMQIIASLKDTLKERALRTFPLKKVRRQISCWRRSPRADCRISLISFCSSHGKSFWLHLAD